MRTTTSPISRHPHRLAVLVVALLAVLPALMGPVTASATPAIREASQHTARTRLTVRTVGCARCRIQLFQAVQGRRHVWQSRSRRAADSEVTFTVPTSRTHGLSMSVRPPWENRASIPTGYVTMTVIRYRGHAPGSTVGYVTARKQKRGSACWAGTRRHTATMRVQVRKVRVQGTTGMTDGTIAWMPVQGRSWTPMERLVGHGIFGTQDVVSCRRP